MNLIEIYIDGIKFSYSLIILIFTILIWFSFSKFKKGENGFSLVADKNLKCHSDYKMTICIRQGAYKKAIKKYPKMVESWERSGQAKVVLKVSPKELFESERRAKEKNITSCLIKDAGRTQISPGEYTAVAIGPGFYNKEIIMSLNILPFQILFNGKLPKKNPFNQHDQSIKSPAKFGEKVINSNISASFRGRRLNGRMIDISKSNHSILILSKNDSRKELDINIEKSLNQVTYWNYDDEIKNFDDVPQFLNAIHYFNTLNRET
ncbi:uncharacterized protein cubi_03545 [Cryptosporidium ubiquitum]|uniref:peptidyl-tRNA hydrolase n=1 Tax=Cryptosporidium ubiquitum TaxID=857276 RepID=A0A1J4MJW8_9CRYT|nr:uncharacterized protein cubi_03545 [Cryptosporidium ubiquitum]OII73747.1 hypothetical protein cubi_03545 [Cryptosporidium ubiquitum]